MRNLDFNGHDPSSPSVKCFWLFRMIIKYDAVQCSKAEWWVSKLAAAIQMSVPTLGGHEKLPHQLLVKRWWKINILRFQFASLNSLNTRLKPTIRYVAPLWALPTSKTILAVGLAQELPHLKCDLLPRWSLQVSEESRRQSYKSPKFAIDGEDSLTLQIIT